MMSSSTRRPPMTVTRCSPRQVGKSTTVLPFCVTSTSASLTAEEQVPVEAAMCAAVHVVLGLADDEPAQPFLEPRGLVTMSASTPCDHERADEGETWRDLRPLTFSGPSGLMEY